MLQPWQLIKLKAEYGQIYTYQLKDGTYVIARQPNITEIKQQFEIREKFNLTLEETFTEIAKQTLVFPEDPDEVPEFQIRQIAETMLNDIPLSRDELNGFVNGLMDKPLDPYMEMALELWSKIQGSTIKDFLDMPLKESLAMYTYIQALKVAHQQLEEQRLQAELQSYNQQYSQQQQQQAYGTQNPNARQQSFTLEDIQGKTIDDIVQMLGGK